MQKIQMEALAYIRGRSIMNQYVIVDECQNLTPHEVVNYYLSYPDSSIDENHYQQVWRRNENGSNWWSLSNW